MDKPIVMVSSTCYDLKQIRNELKTFLETIGYDSLLSESSSFQVNPEMGTIENCKNKVEIYADIMVLIIGGRYGGRVQFCSQFHHRISSRRHQVYSIAQLVFLGLYTPYQKPNLLRIQLDNKILV